MSALHFYEREGFVVERVERSGTSAALDVVWRVRELERQLRRKDKALAEAAALLVLQKKFQAFYGEGES